MTVLKHPIFLCCLLLATAIYLGQRLQVALPDWVNFYVNDFLCMPIVLSLCLAVLRLVKKNETLYVPLSVVVVLTLYFSVYFEWLMPQTNTRYTSDLIDVALYFIGAILFFKLQKKLF